MEQGTPSFREKFGMAYTQDESYYLLDAGHDACVYLGLRDGVDRDAMSAELHRSLTGEPFDTERYVNKWPARKHDHFLIPAGTVHCSLTDLAHYADLHARGQFADAPLLKHESFLKLHTAPSGQDYAMGWIVASRPWAGGTALTHVGSNTTFLVDIWVAPEKHAVLIAATNTANDAPLATDEMIGVLVRRFVKEAE